MSREIKFRGIREDNGLWAYGNLNIEFDGTHHICWWQSDLIEPETNFHEPVHYQTKVRPETVGQFVGRLDVRGNEIYEGDIIQYSIGFLKTEQVTQQIVTYYQDGFQLVTTKKRIKRSYMNQEILPAPRRANYNEWTRCVVLGNIHENPELL